MSYKAGNLEVALTSLDNGIDSSLDAVISRLSNLATAIKAVTKDDTKWITSLGQAFKTLGTSLPLVTTAMNELSKTDTSKWSATAKGFNSITETMSPFLNKLSETSKGLSSFSSVLSKVSSEQKINTIQTGFTKLATAITPFIDKVSSAKEELVALSNVAKTMTSKRALKNLSSLGTSDNKTTGASGKNLSNWLTLGKTIFFAKQLARQVSSLVQYAVDYTETLNMWQVAMRENLDQADEFIKKMNKAYSISQETLMNAQATFKNMIGSLGNVSDATAYALSESITQMALDFSSLYNTTFENAITKFEAVLSGQVRPIRSVSGYDITDSTLYQVYKELGGTKTQRNLNRTEKQLLAIYAVFQQMERSGAVGDLSKTLDNFSNQSRMMTENFKELKTYVGLFFEELLQSWGVLKYINAALIFATELVKAMVDYETPDFLQGMFEETTAETDALDELQGKLLDFDKFRALNTSADSDVAIDQTVLDALSSYSSILDDVNNEARTLAETWLKTFGIMDDEGNIVSKRIAEIKENLIAVVSAAGAIATILAGATIVNFIKKITNLTSGVQLLNVALIGGLVYSLVKLSQALKDGDAKTAIFAATISAVLVVSLLSLNKEFLKTASIPIAKFFANLTSSADKSALSLNTATKSLSSYQLALAATTAVMSYLIFDDIFSGLDENSRKTASAIGIVTGAIIALTGAIVAFKAIASGGSALPSLIAAATGAGLLIASIKAQIPQYAMGASDIGSGTIFEAGENGKTEAVYTGSNGKTNVANVKQMKQSFNGALSEWWRYAKNDIPQFSEVSKTGIYEINKKEMKRRGEWR